MKYHKNQKQIYTEAIKHEAFRGYSEHGSQVFWFLLRLFSIILPFLQYHFLQILHQFCIVPVTSHSNILNHVWCGSLPSFFNAILVSSIFSLSFEWNTFFIRLSLPLCLSFTQGWFTLLPLKISPFIFSHQTPKILFPLPVKEKNTMKQIVYETTKVNIPNLFRGWKITTGFIRQWF